MKNNTFEGRFYETYFFANIVHKVLYNQSDYLWLLDDFYNLVQEAGYLRPFPKYSAFHQFIEFLVTHIINDEIANINLDIRQDDFDRYLGTSTALDDLHPASLPIEDAFIYYDIEYFVTKRF